MFNRLMSARVLMAGCLVFLASGRLEAVTISSGQGVSFDQIDYRSASNSNAGQVTADRAALFTATGLSDGFINVADSSGNWIVRNLPVFNAGLADANLMTQHFNIFGTSDGVDVGSLNLSVDYSASPTAAFAPGAPLLFGVGDVGNAVGGVPPATAGAPVAGFRPGPDYSTLSFTGIGVSLTYQNGHANI